MPRSSAASTSCRRSSLSRRMSVSVATHCSSSRCRKHPNPSFHGLPRMHDKSMLCQAGEESRPAALLRLARWTSSLPCAARPSAGTDFTIAEWADDGESSAERPIAPLHLHRADDEAWYVLEGTLGFAPRRRAARGARRRRRCSSRAASPHTYWNAGAGAARYLIVMTPRIAALIEALHEPGVRRPDGALRAVRLRARR